MLSPSMLIFIVISLLALYLGYQTYKTNQFNRAVNRPFPDEYQTVLMDKLPIYPRLTMAQKKSLHHHILSFLYTKTFVGCNELMITDEMRVVIAAEACLLILNRPTTCYQHLKWIYVYPSVFIAQRAEKNEYGIVANEKKHLLGESWQNGKVILAWDSIKSGMENFHDGQNVVLHEFAHQLDQESGSANGAPLLYNKNSYQVWSKVFSEEFHQLQQEVLTGHQSVIDRYGATNPAEFFAVVTEVFFERPSVLQKNHPEIFKLLMNYYQLDPSLWQ